MTILLTKFSYGAIIGTVVTTQSRCLHIPCSNTVHTILLPKDGGYFVALLLPLLAVMYSGPLVLFAWVMYWYFEQLFCFYYNLVFLLLYLNGIYGAITIAGAAPFVVAYYLMGKVFTATTREWIVYRIYQVCIVVYIFLVAASLFDRIYHELLPYLGPLSQEAAYCMYEDETDMVVNPDTLLVTLEEIVDMQTRALVHGARLTPAQAAIYRDFAVDIIMLEHLDEDVPSDLDNRLSALVCQRLFQMVDECNFLVNAVDSYFLIADSDVRQVYKLSIFKNLFFKACVDFIFLNPITFPNLATDIAVGEEESFFSLCRDDAAFLRSFISRTREFEVIDPNQAITFFISLDNYLRQQPQTSAELYAQILAEYSRFGWYPKLITAEAAPLLLSTESSSVSNILVADSKVPSILVSFSERIPSGSIDDSLMGPQSEVCPARSLWSQIVKQQPGQLFYGHNNLIRPPLVVVCSDPASDVSLGGVTHVWPAEARVNSSEFDSKVKSCLDKIAASPKDYGYFKNFLYNTGIVHYPICAVDQNNYLDVEVSKAIVAGLKKAA